MQLSPTTQQPAPPARWTKFWQHPIVSFDYGATSRIAPDAIWREGWLPAKQSITGDRLLELRFGGTSRAEAVRAAKLLTQKTRGFEVDAVDGSRMLVEVNPAMGILHDRDSGSFWIAPLDASVRVGSEWLGGVHSVDGAAFEGVSPILGAVTVRTAIDELVAVVGRDSVITPMPWIERKGGPTG